MPLRIEIGPRDLENESVMTKLRVAELDDRGKPVKETLPMADLGLSVGKALDQFQAQLFDNAKARLDAETVQVDSWSDFTDVFEGAGSKFVYAHWDGTAETESAIKEATKATIRCIPTDGDGPAPEPGKCIKTGADSNQRVLFAKNY